MTAIEAARRYFDAWNARDADAILASLTEGGSYRDPLTPGPISGEAIRGYVSGLWSAFPDLSFDIRSVAETGPASVAAEWVMRGVNRGSFAGLPPTGREVVLDGADFLTVEGDRVSSVTGYFDSAVVPRQLGLAVVVQPHEIGPYRFGVSTAIHSGRMDAPAAVSLTQLEARGDEAVEAVSERSRHILAEMLSDPAFIGATTARIGRRMVTISAWSDPDAPQRFARRDTHGKAMREFYDGSLADSGYTGTWTAGRVGAYYLRCTECGRMGTRDPGPGRCGCGAELPARPAYW